MTNKKKKLNLEIERKFLLKNLPACMYDKILEIEQFYCNAPGKPNIRVRSSFDYADGKTTYTKTMKRRISMGVNEEIESKIDKNTFDEYVKSSDRVIKKVRYVKKVGRLKWEIDRYTNIKLVVAEVELKDINQIVPIPVFIRQNLIMEVTRHKEFSNRSMACKYNTTR